MKFVFLAFCKIRNKRTVEILFQKKGGSGIDNCQNNSR